MCATLGAASIARNLHVIREFILLAVRSDKQPEKESGKPELPLKGERVFEMSKTLIAITVAANMVAAAAWAGPWASISFSDRRRIDVAARMSPRATSIIRPVGAVLRPVGRRGSTAPT